jgi:cardiolipin synthase
MMLRIDNEDCANFLAADFLSTWHGMPMYSKASFDGVTLYALDGIHNKAGFVDLFAMIATAKVSIDVVSAYPTFPFMDALGSAVARGVSVQLYTPLPNNKPLVRDYLLDAARRSGITVGLLPEMTHLKAMLIDGHTLIAGSSNFDFVSYHVQEELLALVTIPELIEEFKQQVLTVAAGASLPGAAHRQHPFASLRARAALWATDAVVRRLQHNRRGAVDWSAAPIRSLRRPPIETVASGS